MFCRNYVSVADRKYRNPFCNINNSSSQSFIINLSGCGLRYRRNLKLNMEHLTAGSSSSAVFLCPHRSNLSQLCNFDILFSIPFDHGLIKARYRKVLRPPVIWSATYRWRVFLCRFSVHSCFAGDRIGLVIVHKQVPGCQKTETSRPLPELQDGRDRDRPRRIRRVLVQIYHLTIREIVISRTMFLCFSSRFCDRIRRKIDEIPTFLFPLLLFCSLLPVLQKGLYPLFLALHALFMLPAGPL